MTESTSITFDGSLEIATGRSRRETLWKNRAVQWSDLIKKLSVTHRTAETHAEFMSSKKIRQDEIKDIGGFVGGYLTGGKRKSGSIAHRQLLTLDMDYAEASQWELFQLYYGNAALIYSTHKHSPDGPRLRLVMPLDREVFTDEYVAIARRVAGTVGIDAFDPTTYQPERLMYWPSTSSDGIYEFNYQDGPWLSADQTLAFYRDWRDSSEWPMSDRESSMPLRAIKKQGDPLEKPGIVGAFCRTYSISEAIDAFLEGIYEPCDIEGRYTYKEGSTAAGLVVYEDKYAYSHHGTDPVSGKLCNAFDLVRLHKYGLKDEDARDGTPGNKLPSYTEMIGFSSQDPRVRKQLGNERLSDARVDFEIIDDELPIDAAVESDEWLTEMDVDRKGNYFSTINNIVLILENDPRLKGRIAFDEFEQRAVAIKNLPWRKITDRTKYLTDRDDDNLSHYLEKVYDIACTKLDKALNVIYERTRFHPVRDYLNALQWDQEPRVESLFIEYMGAADSEYIRAVTRKTIVAAVARVFQPGVKFDYALTIVGRQGLGKSSLIGKLGRQWFSDSFSTVQGKEAYEQIQGVWLVEIGELAGLKKAEVETIKHYLSKREDRYRVAYGKRVENFPRQCVFFASTNKPDFLRDTTGNRRFWPVDVSGGHPTKNVFKDLTGEEVDQIWAEAVYMYHDGETLYLPKDIEDTAYRVQAMHSEHDERAGLITKYLDTLLPSNWDEITDLYERRSYVNGDELLKAGTMQRDRVCAAEIWCEALGGMQKEMSSQNTKFIHDIMRNLEGWGEYKSKTVFKHYGNVKGYFRIKNIAAVKSENTAAVKTVGLK